MTEPPTIPIVVQEDNSLPPIGTEVHLRFTFVQQQQQQQQQQEQQQGEHGEPPPQVFSYTVEGEDGERLGSTELIGYVGNQLRRAEVVAVEPAAGDRFVVRVRLLGDD